jgi:serine protease
VVARPATAAGHAVSTPANCPGVIAVAGLRHAGTKVGFSDLGPEIALSAPGRQLRGYRAERCLPVSDPYDHQPRADDPRAHSGGGSTYTDAFNPSIGTSFSAPLVAGTVA